MPPSPHASRVARECGIPAVVGGWADDLARASDRVARDRSVLVGVAVGGLNVETCRRTASDRDHSGSEAKESRLAALAASPPGRFACCITRSHRAAGEHARIATTTGVDFAIAADVQRS
jgi:hypothetical protein